MVKLDLLEMLIIEKVVWRSVSTASGVLCVTRCGITLMLEWSADNFIWPQMVVLVSSLLSMCH